MPEKTLRELDKHLGAVEIDDSQVRVQAAEIRQHVQQMLNDDKLQDEDRRQTLVERLNEALVLFRNDHPSTADAIRHAIDILSAGGV